MYEIQNKAINRVLTVGQITAQLKEIIEEVFSDVYIVGEISNAKIYPSGHWYFSLKDKDATLSCVCFRNANQSIKFVLEDGLLMVAHGRLSVYPPRGNYQMIVDSLEPVGIGDWQLAVEQLKERLGAEGLLEPGRKRPIPILPKKIGVVTSVAGAALKDILSALKRRNKNVHVVIASAKVQGEGSKEDIVQALIDLQQDADIEVIIIARGGGSIEDLWSFNTELVARAVAECRVPVISGVGHETDITICDLVADMRAPTPTAAAELVAKGLTEILDQWSYLHKRLLGLMQDKLNRLKRSLERLNPLSTLSSYQQRLHRHRLEVLHKQERLRFATNRLIATLKSRFQQNNEKLQSLGPKNVMKRGFSILRNSQKQVIHSYAETQSGETLEALLETGKLTLVVQFQKNSWGD
jgi:exodeoxyribonuclease VII large subunit